MQANEVKSAMSFLPPGFLFASTAIAVGAPLCFFYGPAFFSIFFALYYIDEGKPLVLVCVGIGVSISDHFEEDVGLLVNHHNCRAIVGLAAVMCQRSKGD